MVVRISESAREREAFRYDPYLIPDAASNSHDQLLASPDTTLRALAQLGAIRLGATRSLISIFDHDTQYIAAEATPTLTLAPSATDDDIWACGTTVPRATSLCEHVLVASENDAFEWHPEADLLVQVIPDLAADERFHKAEQIHQKPFHRFYAGVAIRSPRGINIGVFCVFDTKPRPGLEAHERQVMKELSASITSYLECRRSSERFRRSERMVRGIGDFVQSKATDPRRPPKDIAGLLRNGAAPRSGMSHMRPDAHQALAAETAEDRSAASDTAAGNTPESREALLRSLFSRSADVIRESIEVDGVTFLDASISTFAGLVPRTHSSDQSGTSSSEDDPLKRQLNPEERHCQVLGTSTSEPAPSDGGAVLPGQTVVPDLALESLLRRYPRGVIFNFDDSGEVQSGDDSDGSSISSAKGGQSDEPSIKPSRAAASRQKDAKMLLSLCPGARTVALVPLWDLNKERWFAGGFVWTTSMSRVSTLEGDLSFLRAFGMTIMAEVGLIEATLSDRAKADVLGSLSHELRSPLHGVVAAVDLLHGTKLDDFQSDVVHTIETSGRTLLDTIDHLLDYSKINSFVETSARERRKNKLSRASPSDRGRQQSLATGIGSLTSDVQLDIIVEEVVEVVFAGHNFYHSVNAADILGHNSKARADQLQRKTSPVSVYLDIDPSVPWGLRARTGALRRIIMNLFGNALKYTDKGWISISLRQQRFSPHGKSSRPVSPMAVLTVSDSGRGIGQDFLRTKLFTPFTQEDGLSAGSGLGLSLVHQIVSDLGGTIAVESELGRGTSVRVTLPLTPPLQSPQELGAEPVADVQKLKGLRVFLSGLSEACEIPMPTRHDAKLTCSEVYLIASLCRGWLRLEVVAMAEQADLVICNDHDLQHLDSEALGAGQPSAPVVVICRNAIVAHDHAVAQKAAGRDLGYKFVSQPVGPRKLAKTIVNALSRWREAHSAPAGTSLQDSSLPSAATPEPSPSRMPELANLPAASIEAVKTMDLPVRPISKDSAPPTQPNEAPPSQPPLSTVESSPTADEKPVFLLVDDNKINLKILSSYMTKSNIDHSTALDGLQALERYVEAPGRFSYVLMDISMPVMDGLESTRRIREFERTSKLKAATIVALTGLASASIQQEAFASGIDLFLTKPVRLKDLDGILGFK